MSYFITVREETVAQLLGERQIPFKVTAPRRSRPRIYVIESFPFLGIELKQLLERNEFHVDGIRKLRREIEDQGPGRS
jgi:hypothetical protein